MATDLRRPPRSPVALVTAGSALTAVGGFGVAFRASGLGSLPGSAALLTAGLAGLSAGLGAARAARRRMVRRVVGTAPTAPAPGMADRPVRVPAWTTIDRVLGP